ncbi:hypothetical protein MG293_020274 [Ovis ammon polii]|uniref:Uncharacterized protein n=1 Tax=Ovis ammon polii TaxID=230172 RepID=A0AAD4TMF5_OVIAM|nr:hypothetical protein MG293_020274 [Ovis ammon polii]
MLEDVGRYRNKRNTSYDRFKCQWNVKRHRAFVPSQALCPGLPKCCICHEEKRDIAPTFKEVEVKTGWDDKGKTALSLETARDRKPELRTMHQLKSLEDSSQRQGGRKTPLTAMDNKKTYHFPGPLRDLILKAFEIGPLPNSHEVRLEFIFGRQYFLSSHSSGRLISE